MYICVRKKVELFWSALTSKKLSIQLAGGIETGIIIEEQKKT